LPLYLPLRLQAYPFFYDKELIRAPARMRSGYVLPAVRPGSAHVHRGRGIPLPTHGLLLRLWDGPPLGLLLSDHRYRLVFRYREVCRVI
jgi:hypothetical protein